MQNRYSGSALRRIRKKRDLSIKDVAALTDINHKTLYNWEEYGFPKSITKKREADIERLCEELQCCDEDLWTPTFRHLYDSMKIEIDEQIHNDEPFLEKSAEIRQWLTLIHKVETQSGEIVESDGETSDIGKQVGEFLDEL